MKQRDYQLDFYGSCDRVRDYTSRMKIANKIQFVLDEILGLDTHSYACLDIGCSSGVVSTAIAPRFSRMVGLDIDKLALAEIEPGYDQKSVFLQGDAMQMPFHGETLDMIFCLQVYEHVPDDERMMSEIFRVLKPGGYVIFSGPNRLFPIEPHYFLPFLHWLPAKLADRYLRVTGKGSSYYERSRSYWGLRRLVRDFNMKDISLEIVRFRMRTKLPQRMGGILEHTIYWLLKPAILLLPNYNWILRK
jgi:SAM-dependent methyltransferase